MKEVIIGNIEIYASTNKELLYKIAKRFYLKDGNSVIFKPVRVGDNEDKKDSIFVDILPNYHNTFFKMNPESYADWGNIVKSLKDKYKGLEKNEEIVDPDIDKKLKIIIEKVKKIRKGTDLYTILQYAPINEKGVSEFFYFKDLKPEDKRLEPNNGIAWLRRAKELFLIEVDRPKNLTLGFKFAGFNLDGETKNRQVRYDIRIAFDHIDCAHCGSHNKKYNKHEIDHKNGRYDDDEVFELRTQNINQFQALCPDHNKLKRNACKKCKENGIRFDAEFLGYDISVTKGSLEYNNEIGCDGCYWYDPIDFKSKLTYKNINKEE